MLHRSFKLTRANAGVASNPAAASVNWLRWVRYYPMWPIILTMLFAVNIYIWLFAMWVYLRRVKAHFQKGDANPGIVIQINPTLVAVATDLRRGVDSYPAIKVIRVNLRRMMGKQPQVGTCLPTVALYSNYFASLKWRFPRWNNFHPLPLECATGNKQTLERVMVSFTEEQWQFLQDGIRQLPSHKPGLYMLKTPPKADSSVS